MSDVNDKLPISLTWIFGTSEPANGSVSFYNIDSACETLNQTILDDALTNTDTFDDYRPHHITSLSGLTLNTTYYYKLNSCDPSKNCAVTSCSNATTAAAHTNITFKLAIPSGWTIDLPSINLSNYSGTYALKVSTEYLDDINLTMNLSSDGVTAVTLVGLSIFEKQTLNMSDISKSGELLSIDSNQYQSFKQKAGLKKVEVNIPTTGTATSLQHCDDDGANCQDVTTQVNCTFVEGSASCAIPDALGLGFSGYSGGGGSSGGSSGGGSGGSPNAGAKSSSSTDTTSPTSSKVIVTKGTKKSSDNTISDTGFGASETGTESNKDSYGEIDTGFVAESVKNTPSPVLQSNKSGFANKLPILLSLVIIFVLLYMFFKKYKGDEHT